VNDDVAASYHHHLIEDTDEEQPNRAFGRFCKLWNKAVDQSPGWPQQRLTRPSFRIRVSYPWEAFPPSLQAELAEMTAVRSGASGTLLDERAPDDPLAVATIIGNIAQLQRYASVVVKGGLPIELATSFAVLVEPKNYARGLQWYLDRDGKNTPGLSEIAGRKG
jgi:hypothetical protein